MKKSIVIISLLLLSSYAYANPGGKVWKQGTATELTDGTSTKGKVWSPKTLSDTYSGAAAEVQDDVYGAGWNGDTTHAPSQNAAYDIINTLQVKPAEGAFADGDKTKLDGIEALADVTDATNVAAAGALMTSSLGTGVEAALGVNIGSAGAPVLFNGAGGTPSALTLTNATGLPIATGVSGLGANVATFLATPTLANLNTALVGAGAESSTSDNFDPDRTSGDTTDDDKLDDAVQGKLLLWSSTASATNVVIGSNRNIELTGSTTITNFYISGAEPTSDIWIRVLFNGSITVDLSSSGIEADNRPADETPNAGAIRFYFYDTTDTQWHAFNAPDAVTTLDDSGTESIIGTDGSNNPTLKTVDDSTIEINSNTLRVKDAGITAAKLGTDADDDAIEFVIDGGGAAITTGQKGHIEVPYACTINSVTTLADQSGSIVVDIWVDTYANFPPTDADSITASAPPTLSTAQKSQDSTLTGWTTSLSKGSIIAYNVDSASTVERVTISLKVDR